MKNIADTILRIMKKINVIEGEDSDVVYDCYEPGRKPMPCNICGGDGWVLNEENKVIRCKNYDVRLNKSRYNELINRAGMGLYPNVNLDSIDNAIEFAKSWAIRYVENPCMWLCITGDSGSGKTYIAIGMGKQFIANNKLVLYLQISSMFGKIKSSWSSGSDYSEQTYLKELRGVDVLILDDLSLYRLSAWERKHLMSVLRFRFDANLPVVVVCRDINPIDREIKLMLNNPQKCAILNLGRGVRDEWEYERQKMS